jgi:hypothetical protein
MISYDAVLGHGYLAAAVILVTHVHSGGNFPSQFRAIVNQLPYPFGLVGGQGVHGVYEQRFYALLGPVVEAVLQNWKQKAFGLAGACASGDKGGGGVFSNQPLHGLSLMDVELATQMNRFK